MEDLDKQKENYSFKSTFSKVITPEIGQKVFLSIQTCGELYMAIDGRRDPSEYWRQVVPPFLCPATVLKNSHSGAASFLVQEHKHWYFNL